MKEGLDFIVDKKLSENKKNKNEKIFEKYLDKSFFDYGTIVPRSAVAILETNLNKSIKEGESVKIKLNIENTFYECTISFPNIKDRNSKLLKINFTKDIKDFLKKNFRLSYEYTRENNSIDENKGLEKAKFFKGSKINEFELRIEIDKSARSQEYKIEKELQYIKEYIKSKGYSYSSELIDNLYLSLKAKPFVILSGISGTGKSKIVKLFAEAIGATRDNGRFNLVSVRPDWTDDSELLGYRDIEGNFKVGAVTSILKAANDNLNEPYFICLDEMNLARVEYYFSTILSLIETKELIDGEIRSNKIFTRESFGTDKESYEIYKDIYISENIFIVGTVNMDETTFPFSKKVLDRANTIEFNEIYLDFDFLFNKEEIQGRVYDNTLLKSNYLKITDCLEDKETALKVIENLKRYNEILIKGNYHFAYRTRDEIIFYVINAVKYNLMDFSKAMDYAIVQKILPKIGGSNESVIEILVEFFNELNGTSYKGDDIAFGTVELSQLEQSIKNYKLSSEKLIYMIRRYLRDGFTGFWQ